MSNELKILAEKRNALLLAEVGVWLHLLGKFSKEFISGKKHSLPDEYLKAITPISSGFSTILKDDKWPQQAWQTLKPIIPQVNASLYQFSTKHTTRNVGIALLRLLVDAHGRGSGTEKGLFYNHTCNPTDAAQTHLDTVFGHTSALLDLEQLDAARGALYTFLEGQLNELKDRLTNKQPVDWLLFRQEFVKRLRDDFLTTVGDTRRPLNDVSLFDQTFATVAFFKTALAQNLLKRQWADPMDKNVSYQWRLLRVGIDGLDFIERAQSASDIIARRNLLTETLNKVQEYLEVCLPLTVEAYRDENGSVYLLPDIPNLLEFQTPNDQPLYQHLSDMVSNTLSQEVTPDISGSDQPSRTLYAFGQLVNRAWPTLTPEPNIVNTWWNEVQASVKIDGKIVHNLEVCTVCGLRPITSGVEQVYKPEQVEYHRRLAYERKVCGYCLERREGRSDKWIKQLSQVSKSTIWIDEVADNDGRVALLVGQFDIDRWLTGELISSLTTVDPADIHSTHSYKNLLTEIHGASDATSLDSLLTLCSLLSDPVRSDLQTIDGLRKFIVGDADLDKFQSQMQVNELLTLALIRKTPSFARLRRVWETTRRFWQEVLPTGENVNLADSIAAQKIGSTGPRLEIKGDFIPANQRNSSPGPFHSYELRLGQTRLSVVWDSDHSRLITCDNLDYAAMLLEKEVKVALESAGTLTIEEPTGYGSRNKEWGKIAISEVRDFPDSNYIPTIPILSEPRTFMALVPADKALEVTQAIKEKYEREMGKVRNRLPLHLGVVYFHRRTPLRAALEAGRRMLGRKQGSDAGQQGDKWQVVNKPKKQCTPLPECVSYLAEGTQQFDEYYAVQLERRGDKRSLTWSVPAVMGDGATEDNWYPYIFLETNGDDSQVNGRNRAFKGLRPTADGQSEACWLIHAGDLKKNDEVYFTPATFDFEWLDTTGRRFEIAYDEEGQRRGRLNRPYLLDELQTLKEVWQIIGGKEGLTNNQIYALRDAIWAKREEWQPASDDCQPDTGTFWLFCRDVIGNAEWKQYPNDKINQLTNWAVSGLLDDVLELRMSIMKEKPERSKPKKERTDEQ